MYIKRRFRNNFGNYVHIACYSSLIGREKIELKDFSGVSSRCCILSSSDDYSGKFLTNPTVPEKYLNVNHAPVILEKHVILGVGTVVLPGITIAEGVAIGVGSFVNKSILDEYEIWAGNPIRYIKIRDNNIIELEKKLYNEE